MATVKMIKNDAVIDIKIGTGFMQKLQQILLFIAKEATPEQLQVYRELSEKGESFPEEWMDHLTTLGVLLKELETQADKQGFTYDGEIPDAPSTEEGN